MKCACGCVHVRDYGACPGYERGANGRCATCDHGEPCHERDKHQLFFNTPMGYGTRGQKIPASLPRGEAFRRVLWRLCAIGVYLAALMQAVLGQAITAVPNELNPAFRADMNTNFANISTLLSERGAYVAGGGTAQAQTVTYSPAVASLASIRGIPICWAPAAANTAGAPTLAVNGLTATAITKYGTTALIANDIVTTAVACAIYDGTQFELQNPQTLPSPATLGLYVAGGGTAQAQTVTYSPAVTSLTNIRGINACWLPTAANTAAAPTLAVNGLTATAITKLGATPLVANDLRTTAVACAIYDGTQFELQNPQTLITQFYIAGGGTAQAQTAAFVPSILSLASVRGTMICWLPAAANTAAAPTLAVNGLTATAITKLGTTALVANDITTTAVACAIYDGTEFQLQNPQTVASGTVTRAISFVIGSPGGNALTTSSVSATLTVPVACTINAYNLAEGPADSGTITVKFWKVATGTAIPTSGNSINTSGVAISSGTAIHSTTVSDFTTTSIAANDMMAMAVTAVSGPTTITGVLQCQ